MAKGRRRGSPHRRLHLLVDATSGEMRYGAKYTMLTSGSIVGRTHRPRAVSARGTTVMLLLLLLLLRSSTGRGVAKATWLIKLHSSCGTQVMHFCDGHGAVCTTRCRVLGFGF